MKSKVNFKLLIAFGIMLLALLTFNISTVNAVATANSLENVPDTIEVGIPTTEAIDEDGYFSAKLSDILYTEVITAIADESIEIEQLSIGFGGEKLLDTAQADVKLYDSDRNLVAEKIVAIKYTDNWNTTDYEYIKNICSKIERFYLDDFEVDYDDNKTRGYQEVIESAYEELINDSTIECTYYVGGGQWMFPSMRTFGILAFGKNNVTYFTVATESVTAQPVITVPETVEDTDEAYINYALSILKNCIQYSDIELKMEKQLGEEYLLYAGDYPEPILILLRKAETSTAVVTTDKDTSIKLKTTSAIVPKDTVLEIQLIKEGTVFDTVKKVVTDVKNFKVFDITLESDGKKIQPNGNVKISIPVPSDMGTENLVVYRVAEDGKKTEYEVTVETVETVKYATFETNHFSTYVLAELSAKGSETPNTNNNQNTSTNTNTGKLDDSPKMGVNDNMIIILSTLLTVISLGAVVTIKRMK